MSALFIQCINIFVHDGSGDQNNMDARLSSRRKRRSPDGVKEEEHEQEAAAAAGGAGGTGGGSTYSSSSSVGAVSLTTHSCDGAAREGRASDGTGGIEHPHHRHGGSEWLSCSSSDHTDVRAADDEDDDDGSGGAGGFEDGIVGDRHDDKLEVRGGGEKM